MLFVALAHAAPPDGFWLVVPDAPGCITFTTDLADAEAIVADALDRWIVDTLERGGTVCVPGLGRPARDDQIELLIPVRPELARRIWQAARGTSRPVDGATPTSPIDR